MPNLKTLEKMVNDMPRYIDADKVMEEIYRIGGHNLCEWDTIGVKVLIYRQPTADVAPRAEVDGLRELNNSLLEAGQEWQKRYENLAREIFAEIEDVLNNIGYFDELDFEALKKKYAEGRNER